MKVKTTNNRCGDRNSNRVSPECKSEEASHLGMDIHLLAMTVFNGLSNSYHLLKRRSGPIERFCSQEETIEETVKLKGNG
jgi:hypothetical protein